MLNKMDMNQNHVWFYPISDFTLFFFIPFWIVGFFFFAQQAFIKDFYNVFQHIFFNYLYGKFLILI